MQKQLTPFEQNIIATALDADGNPVVVADLTDLLVLLLVNGVIKAKYKKIAGDGYLAWTAGVATNQVKCPVDMTLSNGWRGLAQLQIQQQNEDETACTQPRVNLFICCKSGFTSPPSPTVNPITFTTAFSCDAAQNLVFACTVTAPVASYIIEIQIEDQWRRLYEGYVTVSEVEQPVTYTKSVALPWQVAAGTYYIRVKDDISGAVSDELSFYLPDCTEGARRSGRGLMGWPDWFNVYGGVEG